jgi:hypothetical protein
MKKRKVYDLNPKYEARNYKQIQIYQILNSKQFNLMLRTFEFRYCLGFPFRLGTRRRERISRLGFNP